MGHRPYVGVSYMKRGTKKYMKWGSGNGMTMPREWWPNEEEPKMATKERSWDEKSRFEKLSAVMYPMHTSKETQRQMAERAANEGKKSPMQGRREEVMKSTKAKRR
jgi:hypothetical protein